MHSSRRSDTDEHTDARPSRKRVTIGQQESFEVFNTTFHGTAHRRSLDEEAFCAMMAGNNVDHSGERGRPRAKVIIGTSSQRHDLQQGHDSRSKSPVVVGSASQRHSKTRSISPERTPSGSRDKRDQVMVGNAAQRRSVSPERSSGGSRDKRDVEHVFVGTGAQRRCVSPQRSPSGSRDKRDVIAVKQRGGVGEQSKDASSSGPGKVLNDRQQLLMPHSNNDNNNKTDRSRSASPERTHWDPSSELASFTGRQAAAGHSNATQKPGAQMPNSPRSQVSGPGSPRSAVSSSGPVQKQVIAGNQRAAAAGARSDNPLNIGANVSGKPQSAVLLGPALTTSIGSSKDVNNDTNNNHNTTNIRGAGAASGSSASMSTNNTAGMAVNSNRPARLQQLEREQMELQLQLLQAKLRLQKKDELGGMQAGSNKSNSTSSENSISLLDSAVARAPFSEASARNHGHKTSMAALGGSSHANASTKHADEKSLTKVGAQGDKDDSIGESKSTFGNLFGLLRKRSPSPTPSPAKGIEISSRPPDWGNVPPPPFDYTDDNALAER